MAIVEITKENFDTAVLQEQKPVLLDFWAEWCMPCRMLSPIVDEVADEREDIVVGKINVDRDPELAIKFGVQSIPNLIVMKNGVVEQMAVGGRDKAQILALLD